MRGGRRDSQRPGCGSSLRPGRNLDSAEEWKAEVGHSPCSNPPSLSGSQICTCSLSLSSEGYTLAPMSFSLYSEPFKPSATYSSCLISTLPSQWLQGPLGHSRQCHSISDPQQPDSYLCHLSPPLHLHGSHASLAPMHTKAVSITSHMVYWLQATVPHPTTPSLGSQALL